MLGDTSCLIAIPSSSFARAPRDGPLPMSSSLLKSSSYWIILIFENELWFSWQPQPACAKVNCLRSSGGDIDFSQGTMNVTRSIAYGIVGRCKTEASQKPVPVHSILAEALTQWRDRCRYRKPDDWVFANEHHRGRHPYWGQAILRGIIRPVAERIGIKKWIGWHTFRHTYSTLLRSVGTEFKVMQELLRHSSLRSTIDIYQLTGLPVDVQRNGFGCKKDTESCRFCTHECKAKLSYLIDFILAFRTGFEPV